MLRLLRRVLFVLTQPRRAWAVLTRPSYQTHEVAQGLSVKVYESHDDYIRHQQEKLATSSPAWLTDYNTQYRSVLAERLRSFGVVGPTSRVLCLAARLGGEVVACRDLGAFAVGVDLNPGKNNPYVLYGDFHALTFADGSVDVVFTNSLDHALNFKKLFAEVRRVLQPNGLFISEIVKGSAEGVTLGYYDVAVWDSVSTVVKLCEEEGFRVERREEIPFPAGRECVVFRRC